MIWASFCIYGFIHSEDFLIPRNLHNTVPILAQCIDSDMILVSQIKHQFGYLLSSGLNWDANGMRGLKGILPSSFDVWNSSMNDGCRFPLFIIKVAPRSETHTLNRPVQK